MSDQLLDIAAQSISYAKQQGIDAADVSISKEQGFSVSSRKSDIETIEYHQEQGFAITVYNAQKTGSASTTSLNIADIKSAVDKAVSITDYTHADPYGGLPEKDLLAFDYPDLDLYHPWDIDPTQAAQMAIACENISREQDPRITDSEGASVCTYDGVSVYANTLGFTGACRSSYHSLSCQVVVKDGDDMERDSEYTVARDPADLLDAAIIGKQAAKNTLMRLKARKIKTQQCPVIFHHTQAKSLLGAFIGAISGSSLYHKNTFLLDHLGKPVFSDHVHIYQEPHLLKAMGSRPFDHEGVRNMRRDFIKDGVLESYVLGSYSARRLGMQSTGNSGGVFNLSINHSELSFSDLLKEMGTGLLVTELFGQGVRLITGDYSKGAFGFWVENGEIQYPVSEITVAGNLKDMYRGIVAIANDVDRRGNVRTGSMLLNKMTIAGA